LCPDNGSPDFISRGDPERQIPRKDAQSICEISATEP